MESTSPLGPWEPDSGFKVHAGLTLPECVHNSPDGQHGGFQCRTRPAGPDHPCKSASGSRATLERRAQVFPPCPGLFLTVSRGDISRAPITVVSGLLFCAAGAPAAQLGTALMPATAPAGVSNVMTHKQAPPLHGGHDQAVLSLCETPLLCEAARQECEAEGSGPHPTMQHL